MSSQALSRHPLVLLFLAWLAPGSAHFLLGQRWRGAAFFAIIVATFLAGLQLTRSAAVSLENHPLAFLAQVFAGLPLLAGLGIGAATDPATAGGGPFYATPPPPPSVVAVTDLGVLFTMVAGLLNFLLILDAFDRAAAARAAPPPRPPEGRPS